MDTSLISFLTGYLQGKRQRRAEEEAERRIAEQYNIQLAQFLEAQREREAQERYRQAQLEMGMRQLDISERHQTMLEQHYQLMNEAQRTQLEMQKEENALRREEHAWRLMGIQLSLLEGAVNLFGNPERAIQFLRKNPIPAVSQWATTLETSGLNGIAKAKNIPLLMNVVNSWNSDKMPSDSALLSMLKANGLEGIFTLDELRGLMQLRVENIRGATGLDISTFAKKKAIEYEYERRLLQQRLNAQKELQRIAEAKDNSQRLMLGVNYLENPAQFITAVSSVVNPADIPKALNDAEQEVTKIAMSAGLPPETAVFHTTVALGIRVHTDRNVDAVTMSLWERRMKNPAYRRAVEKGAKSLFMVKYGRLPNERELSKYLHEVILNATKDEEIAQLLTHQLRTGATPTVMKATK